MGDCDRTDDAVDPIVQAAIIFGATWVGKSIVAWYASKNEKKKEAEDRDEKEREAERKRVKELEDKIETERRREEDRNENEREKEEKDRKREKQKQHEQDYKEIQDEIARGRKKVCVGCPHSPDLATPCSLGSLLVLMPPSALFAVAPKSIRYTTSGVGLVYQTFKAALHVMNHPGPSAT